MEAEVSVEKISVQDYLESERRSDVKHEYDDGTLIPMSGASIIHTIICNNIAALLWIMSKDKDYTVHSSDLRVSIPLNNRFVYPDVVLVKGIAQVSKFHKDTIINPYTIFEVLSESTEGYDRGDKFQAYRTLESLQAYVLVAQDKPLVEVFTKDTGTGQWVLSEARSTETSIQLPNLEEKLALSDIYAKVKFPQK